MFFMFLVLVCLNYLSIKNPEENDTVSTKILSSKTVFKSVFRLISEEKYIYIL